MSKVDKAKAPPNTIMDAIKYDPETGVFTRTMGTRNGKAHIGDRADKICPKGYGRVKHNGTYYAAHRLAWLFVYGEWPELLVDHKNRNTADNRIANLRLADACQNAWNKEQGDDAGVRERPDGQFNVELFCRHKRYSYGPFSSKASARRAYRKAAVILKGEFAPFNQELGL